MIASTEATPLWTTRHVWLGRIAFLPLALAFNASLLVAAVIQQYFIEPSCELLTRQPRPRWPAPRPQRPWPDIRLIAHMPVPAPAVDSASAPAASHTDSATSFPRLLSSATPSYPELARSKAAQGCVIIVATIDERGRVADAKVARGLPLGCSQSALDAVQRWRYRPAMSGGRPVRASLTATICFALKRTTPSLRAQTSALPSP